MTRSRPKSKRLAAGKSDPVSPGANETKYFHPRLAHHRTVITSRLITTNTHDLNEDSIKLAPDTPRNLREKWADPALFDELGVISMFFTACYSRFPRVASRYWLYIQNERKPPGLNAKAAYFCMSLMQKKETRC